MRILFINIIPPRSKCPLAFYHGIGYLSALLKLHGHKTSLLVIETFNIKSLKERIKIFKPDLLAFSSATNQFPLTQKLIAYIKDKYNKKIILGGIHATVSPIEAIKTPGVFAICRGESEFALLELVNAIEKEKEYRSIKNFWFKENGFIYKNPVRELVDNLDLLPFPDRELFNYSEILATNKDGIEFLASRGCLYKCTYCVEPYLQMLYKRNNKYLRYRSVGNLIEEIKKVITNLNYDGLVTFHDEIFTLNKKWLMEFSEKYSVNIGLPFRCNVRADNIDEKTIRLLEKANCKQLYIGIETGVERLRNRVLKKDVSDSEIFKAFRLAGKSGIRAKAMIMLGIPYETDDSLEQTRRFIEKLNPELRCSLIFQPYAGTVLGRLCRQKRWISDRKVDVFYEDTILNLPGLKRKKLLKMHCDMK